MVTVANVANEDIVRGCAEFLEDNVARIQLKGASLLLDVIGPTGKGDVDVVLGGGSLGDHALVVSKFGLHTLLKVGHVST